MDVWSKNMIQSYLMSYWCPIFNRLIGNTSPNARVTWWFTLSIKKPEIKCRVKSQSDQTINTTHISTF